MLKSNSPKSPKMAYSIPWLLLPTDCTHGGQRSSSKGCLAALGLVCGGSPGLPGPVPTCSLPASPPGSACNSTAYVTTCARLGREPWAGFAQHWGGPTAGRPCQEAEQGALVEQGWQGHKGRFRVGRCQRLPRLFSHPRQPRAHHRSGRAGAPRRRERGADRGHLVSWPETPLSWHSRRKPLGTPSAAFRPHG